MIKRIIASALAVILSMSLLPYKVFADLQSPVQGISQNSIIGHTGDKGKIEPLVRLMFQEPTPSGISDLRPDVTNGTAVHGVEDFYYQVHMQEHPTGRALRSPVGGPKKLVDIIGAGTALNDGIPVQGLDNGKLYKMSIRPSHYHMVDYGIPEGIKPEWAPPTGAAHPFEYVLTDFDTKIEGKGASLEVTWEDTGYATMEYEIGYIQGNYEGKSLSQIRENTSGNQVNYIRWVDIDKGKEKYTDPQTGRTRFRYTIEDNIATGQMYSVFVLSTTDRIDNKLVLKNKETPKIVTATTEIGLSVYSAGRDKIRLEWDPRFIHMTDGAYELAQTQIREFSIGQESGRPIATLYGKQGADIGYYEYREPKTSAYYQLIFIYTLKNGQTLTPEPKTAKVLYIPGELRTKPTTPEIPKPIGENTTITAANKEEFLLPGDLLPDIPLIDYPKNERTFHVNMGKTPTINLVWSAYQEDLSLLYDMMVTDDIGVISSDAKPIIEDLTFNNKENPDDVLYNKDKDQVIGFKHTIRHYYNSEMKKLPIVPNKVYYIKLIAKKQYGDELEAALPVVVTIMFNADGEVFAPPTISKPPLRIDPIGVGKTSITIGWLEKWYEIMAKNPASYPAKEQEKAKDWHSKVYTGASTGAAISFIDRQGAKEHILKQEQDVGIVKSTIGAQVYADHYIDRLVNLGKNVEYEYKFMPYEEVLKGLEAHNATSTDKKDVEAYIELLMRSEIEPDRDYGWKKITPKAAVDDEYTQWKQHEQGNLTPNTSYVFFIKPYAYDYDGTKLQAPLPTWIVGTTLPDGEMGEGTPTVATLSLNEKSDNHISVEWEYNSNFDYEIRYSRLENPDAAAVWPFKISTEIADPSYVENGSKAIVKIDGLFPDTTYNVWIRAKQKRGQRLSAWSNPVTTKTDQLGAPTSPGGLGIAAYQSILEIGQDFKPVDSNHITIEWERNAPDKDLDDLTQDSQRVQKEYRYAIEIADNPEFIDRQQIIVGKDTIGSAAENAEILSRSMVRFGELIANRPYYIRGKTILRASDKENNREIIMESVYTPFIRIITKPSEEEYDGGDKVNEVIYPNKIQETYDGTKWIYEILDTQRVINEMVTGDQFRYVIQVQKYNGQYDPQYRIIRIPQPVVTTLMRRQMELEIRSNILSIQIPAKALEGAMAGTTADGMVEFMFETLKQNDLHGVGMGYEYGFLSTPERMSIRVSNQKGIKSLDKVEALMNVKINMPHQYDYMYRNLGGYTYDALEGKWQKGNHQFDKIKMQLEYTTGAIGTYAVYEKTRMPMATESMSSSMTNVAKKHDIIGLGTRYTPAMVVGIPEYTNILLGIAEKRPQIKLDVRPTIEEENRARYSGLYLGRTSPSLTQEAAISGLVRLYELTSGSPVYPQTTSSVANISNAYQDNIQKAYTLGLINTISPQRSITYQELFDLIEQVID